MKHEDGTVNLKNNSTSEANAGSIIVKQEALDADAEVKLESELMLDDDHEDKHYLTEPNEKKSSLILNGTTSTTMFLGKTVKILLNRCDSEEQRQWKPKQTGVSKVINQSSSHAPTVSMKVEHESEPVEIVSSESYSSVVNVSVQTGVGNGEQLEHNALVKMENDKGPITYKLVGQLPRSQDGSGCDKKPLLRIIKLEECNPQFTHNSPSSIGKANEDVLHKMSQISQPKNRVLVQNEFLSVGIAKAPSTGEDDTSKIAVSQTIIDDLQPNAIVKIEEEEKGDTNRTVAENLSEDRLQPNVKIEELVGSLPGSVVQGENDEKSALKTVPFRGNEAGSESEPQLDAHITIGPTKAHCGKSFSTVLQPKNKVSCDVNRENKSNGKQHACSKCSYRCRKQAELIVHLRVHSGERPFKCKDCPMKFKSKSHLNGHRMTHSSKKPFECKNCAAKFKLKSHLVRHITIHADERRFDCAHCSRRFKSKDILREHMKIHLSSGERLYTCEHCSAKFRQKHALARHLQVHLSEKPYSCPQCPMTFKRSSYLKSHLRLHTGEMPYSCQQCPAKFCRSSNLKMHLTTHSNEKPFSCDQCPRNFKLKFNLKSHKEIHGTKRLCCAQCPDEFKTQQALRRHMKSVHTDIGNWHACNQCSYRTYDKSSLKVHLLVHSNERPFSCDQCHKKFKTCLKLKRHAWVHTNEKSFSCGKCSTTFKYKRNLQAHLKRYSVGNRYACTLCPFATPFAHFLRIHSSVHADGRKYSCEHCPAKFNAKSHLKRHLVVHTREEQYQCLHCSSKFTLKYNLVKHLKKHQQEKVPSK